MKICPVCGTENEDSAQNCQLCNFEFDMYKKIQPVAIPASAEKTPEMQKPAEKDEIVSVNQSKKSGSSALTPYVIIAALITIIMIGFRYFSDSGSKDERTVSVSNHSENSVSNTLTETTGSIQAQSITQASTEKISPTQNHTTPPTETPTEPKTPPEISCEIKTEKGQYEGCSYTLYVNGSYDYYYIECNEYSEGEPDTPYQVLSGDRSESVLYLTAGSSLSRVTASVTPYYSDGTKGKTVNCTSIQPEVSVSVQVYSCEKKGEINGRGVAGFTTSYVVDGGAKTTVRDELGDRWHVTAKNYCSAYGITWYELWDSDDGDYYGWVDSSYISFYSENSSSSSVTVESVTFYGEIDGYGVPGYTTSYIVNGGSKSTVRKELGNGWHITAVNYCYSHGTHWYELYDTDDGDYYGWVDRDHIAFYSFNDWD